MEEEQQQLTPEPVPEQDNEIMPEPESPENNGFPENENAGILPEPESPVNTGFGENETAEKEDPASESETGSGTEDGDRQDSGTEEDENGSITNITIVRPPAQIAYNMTADTDATYHVTVENEPDAPVPVVIAETFVETEREPGIMEKRLEDYSVTEGLLLCILIVLILRMILDYGRRLF